MLPLKTRKLIGVDENGVAWPLPACSVSSAVEPVEIGGNVVLLVPV